MKNSIKITLGLGISVLLYFLLKKNKTKSTSILDLRLEPQQLLEEDALKTAKEKARLFEVRTEKAVALAKEKEKALALVKETERGLALSIKNANSLMEKNRLKEEARLALIERERLIKEANDAKIDPNKGGYGGIKPLPTNRDLGLDFDTPRSGDNNEGGSDFKDLGLEFDMPTSPRPRIIGTSKGVGVGFLN